MVYPTLLPLMRTPRLPVVYWTDAPADLNGLVRFAGWRNLVSARVPSRFKHWHVLLSYLVGKGLCRRERPSECAVGICATCDVLRCFCSYFGHGMVQCSPTLTSIQDLFQLNPWKTPVAAVTVHSAPDDGRKGRPKHVERTCSC